MRIIINQSTKKRIFKYTIALLTIMAGAAAVYFSFFYQRQKEEFIPPVIDPTILQDLALQDNRSLYSETDPYKVWTVYAVVYQGTDEKSGGVFNLDDLNAITTLSPDPQLDASVRVVDPDTGKTILGNDTDQVNSILSLRGQSARKAEQKSYKIKLFDGQGTFEGQQVLNLNKHTVDTSRAAQKFCFDRIAEFSDMVSLRTTFFVLYLKDGSKAGAEYENYGLFTHVEQPNQTFLSQHGLDLNGVLYKPTDFEFRESDDILAVDDPAFNYDLFSQLLKIRENPDNEKLARMLAAINNDALDFNLTFQEYFDLDNYLTWCAMNLLLNNYDTMSRNFLLYSPNYSEKWYFLPWDYDASMMSMERFAQRGLTDYFGISRYWGSVLHRKFFQDPDNVQLLSEKMDLLYEQMMGLDWNRLEENYTNAVLKGFLGSVDEIEANTDAGEISSNIQQFQDRISQYYQLYYNTLEKPMPIFLGSEKQAENSTFIFNWSPSKDLQADRLYYIFSIFTDYQQSASSTLYSNEVTLTQQKLDFILPDGIYYWSVVIVDGKGNQQIAYDRLKVADENGASHYEFGIKRFEVKNGLLQQSGD